MHDQHVGQEGQKIKVDMDFWNIEDKLTRGTAILLGLRVTVFLKFYRTRVGDEVEFT